MFRMKILSVVTLAGLCIVSSVFAAELLDVKPVVSGSNVEIQITSDIPMTYTYYKVPGQARAVLDIADADPEKVEPLIVVNKGAVSSISVDKAQISGMVVSRIVFNLTAESDIAAQASADRKLVTVTFGGATAQPPALKASTPEPIVAQVQPAEPPVKQAPVVPAPVAVGVAEAHKAAPAASVKEEDPLGLDEPAAPPIATAATTEKKPEPAKPAAEAHAAVKLEPVVPTTATAAAPAVIRGIVVGATSVDIQANIRLDKYTLIKLVKPTRLAIDIPHAKSVMTSKSIPVGRMGISKIRVGLQKDGIRVVMDTDKTTFPAYSITAVDGGLRISFK